MLDEFEHFCAYTGCAENIRLRTAQTPAVRHLVAPVLLRLSEYVRAIGEISRVCLHEEGDEC
jgi:hypothetical protein